MPDAIAKCTRMTVIEMHMIVLHSFRLHCQQFHETSRLLGPKSVGTLQVLMSKDSVSSLNPCNINIH